MTLHRVLLVAMVMAVFVWLGVTLDWSWLPTYIDNGLIFAGLWTTIWILVVSWVIGLFLAMWLGLAQAAGPWYLALPAKGFCSVIRGTPLLLQLWFVYYGLGSLFPEFPSIRHSAAWTVLREAWPYAVFALSISLAGYEGEVMRGAFLSVPRGQLEAARAYGMPAITILRRIWLPQAVRRVLPTIGGETVLLLKSTPLVATITVPDLYQASLHIRQDTYVIYPPLLLLALTYMVITGFIVLLFHWLEHRVPSKAV
ncbi:ABC transporter permease [Sinorhizobium meliloti]|uniref:ABC transporter permease n=1 Tax=Rhizobium meliloti TaxID=382 RepID=UPI001296D79C|nr:ABC transporter permease subunit [Sinorhizobium meliloti]MDW9714412.1 ABC transporter permease subunit [Sinorhizobium meliloti]MDW9751624.1 ABC transporter permease subunit [Sinorhizobium meliloti]MDX0359468.1 ABC transporter permease subunit [Sinorhizobium meliloti]MQW56135.1 ABC transporter permease subunit [Sinorhizobium meliloti]